jgi:hypothetical protein
MATTNIQSFAGDVEVSGELTVTGQLNSTTGSDKVKLTETTSNETDYIPLSKGATGAQALYTDSNLTYNPANNVIGANISGNATFATSATNANAANAVAFTSRDSTDDTDYIAFVDGHGDGDKALFTDQNLTYNSSTNQIGANISGNATFATSATNANAANKVAFTNRDSTDDTDYIAFVDGHAAEDKALFTDQNLTYNSSTNQIGANISGNATFATSATNANAANKVAFTNRDSTDDTDYIAFVDGHAAEDKALFTDQNLTYNSSTGQIGANISGNATYANSAGSATNANYAGSTAYATSAGSATNATFATNAGGVSVTTSQTKFGLNAGQTSQGPDSVAIGKEAGRYNQGSWATAMGYQAGYANQGNYGAIALGYKAGYCNQDQYSAAVGRQAGSNNQGSHSVAVGIESGQSNQGDFSTAVGSRAGQYNQGYQCVAIGASAGAYNQPWGSIAVGAMRFASGNQYVIYNNSTGELSRGNNYSDDRLKYNEKVITGAIQSLFKLRPEEYDKKPSLKPTHAGQNWAHESGLIAQEIYYSAPEFRHIVQVPQTAGDVEKYTPPPSDDPNQDPDYSVWGEESPSVKYEQFVPYLIKGVQEIVTELPRSKTTVSNAWGQNIVGLVVSANANAHKTNTTPIVALSNVYMDKKWYGVVSEKKTDTNDYDTLVDTKGDTQIWVTDIGGPLESGDLVTTSNVAPGYTQKQGDDLLRSSTVAKVTQDCDFTEPAQRPIRVPKRELSNVTYYLRVTEQDINLDAYEKLFDTQRKIKTTPVYVKEVGENEGGEEQFFHGETQVSEEKYKTLPEDERSKKLIVELEVDDHEKLSDEEKAEYTLGTRERWFVLTTSKSKSPIPEHDEELVVEELVDVLDENGQIVWEETANAVPVYTLVDHSSYKAALVSAKLV